MSRLKETDVLVVGAGPVGLFTALTLALRGARVEVIDQRRRAASRSYGLALHPETLRLLDAAGLGDRIMEQAITIDVVAFYEGTTRHAELRFADLPGAHRFLIACPQDRLERVLEGAVEDRGVKIHWDHRLAALEEDEEGVRWKVEHLEPMNIGYGVIGLDWVVTGQEIGHSRYLVGADGYDSLVRRRLGIPYEPTEASCELALYEFESESCPPHEVRVVLDATSSNVLWPLPEGRMRWTFQRSSDEPRELSRPQLLAALARRAPWFKEEIGELLWTETRFVEPRVAERMHDGNVWLAGDAAHSRQPIGVQGMNVGMQEGHELAVRLHHHLQGRSQPSDLETYENDCRAAWRTLLAPRVFRGDNGWVNARAERILPCVPGTGSTLEALLAQIGLFAE